MGKYKFCVQDDFVESLPLDLKFMKNFSTNLKEYIICKTWKDKENYNILLIYALEENIFVCEEFPLKLINSEMYDKIKIWVENEIVRKIKLYELNRYIKHIMDLDSIVKYDDISRYYEDNKELNILMNSYVTMQANKYGYTLKDSWYSEDGYDRWKNLQYEIDGSICWLLSIFDKTSLIKDKKI